MRNMKYLIFSFLILGACAHYPPQEQQDRDYCHWMTKSNGGSDNSGNQGLALIASIAAAHHRANAFDSCMSDRAELRAARQTSVPPPAAAPAITQSHDACSAGCANMAVKGWLEQGETTFTCIAKMCH